MQKFHIVSYFTAPTTWGFFLLILGLFHSFFPGKPGPIPRTRTFFVLLFYVNFLIVNIAQGRIFHLGPQLSLLSPCCPSIRLKVHNFPHPPAPKPEPPRCLHNLYVTTRTRNIFCFLGYFCSKFLIDFRVFRALSLRFLGNVRSWH